MLLRDGIEVDEEALRAFCRQNGIRRLLLFGSALRSDFGAESDIDLLAEFEPGSTPGLIRLSGMERALERLFGGRRVDLRTYGDLSRYFRDDVVAGASIVYDTAA